MTIDTYILYAGRRGGFESRRSHTNWDFSSHHAQQVENDYFVGTQNSFCVFGIPPVSPAPDASVTSVRRQKYTAGTVMEVCTGAGTGHLGKIGTISTRYGHIVTSSKHEARKHAHNPVPYQQYPAQTSTGGTRGVPSTHDQPRNPTNTPNSTSKNRNMKGNLF